MIQVTDTPHNIVTDKGSLRRSSLHARSPTSQPRNPQSPASARAQRLVWSTSAASDDAAAGLEATAASVASEAAHWHPRQRLFARTSPTAAASKARESNAVIALTAAADAADALSAALAIERASITAILASASASAASDRAAAASASAASAQKHARLEARIMELEGSLKNASAALYRAVSPAAAVHQLRPVSPVSSESSFLEEEVSTGNAAEVGGVVIDTIIFAASDGSDSPPPQPHRVARDDDDGSEANAGHLQEQLRVREVGLGRFDRRPTVLHKRTKHLPECCAGGDGGCIIA